MALDCSNNPLCEHNSHLMLQGSDTLKLFDDPTDSASTDIEKWIHMAEDERLLLNLNAFLDLERKLERMVEQHSNRTYSTEDGLFGGLQDVLAQVAALKGQMAQIGVFMGLSIDTTPNTEDVKSKGDEFDEKVEGYRVLKELSFWIIRSVRDMRKLLGYNGVETENFSNHEI
uniref:Uncharacterized protein n=2 Tax=Xenopus tropicalis TaxID=8364 RepID=A0A6I8T1Q4_XENTR